MDVKLVKIGERKIGAIRIVRANAGIGLKDAKDLVDRVGSAAVVVAADLPPRLAMRMVAEFTANGDVAETVGEVEVMSTVDRAIRALLAYREGLPPFALEVEALEEVAGHLRKIVGE